MLAIIGGSGLTRLASLEVSKRLPMATPYGEPSAFLTFGTICEREAVFLARHGDEHRIAPHQVNYRANLWALSECAVTGIVAIAAVGSIRADLHPGSLVIPHQIIDYTWGRESTYHQSTYYPSADLPSTDQGQAAVTHVDFTEPYDGGLRRRLAEAAAAAGVAVSGAGVYAATQGPRLETAAEITRLERDGADVVGMTGMPEAALARELGLPYAALNVVANYAAGRGGSGQSISLEAIHRVLEEAMGKVHAIIERMVTADV